MRARFCSSCGAALTPAAQFCPSCGSTVGTPPVHEAAVPDAGLAVDTLPIAPSGYSAAPPDVPWEGRTGSARRRRALRRLRLVDSRRLVRRHAIPPAICSSRTGGGTV
ncbi:zinc ribbon domain-containing protein [Geodermatophilus sp. SYSU D00710]